MPKRVLENDSPEGEGHTGRWAEHGREWIIQRPEKSLCQCGETPGLAAHGPQDPAQGSQTQFSKSLKSLLLLLNSSPLIPVSRLAAMWSVPSLKVNNLACLSPARG